MPAMTLCNECGAIVQTGWALAWHMKKHHGPAAREEQDVEAITTETEQDGLLMDQSDDAIDAPFAVAHSTATRKYFAELEGAGTLDLEFVMKFMDWGTFEPSRRVLETIKFLRAMSARGGSSTIHANCVLRYCRSASKRLEYLLPKTVQTCWNLVARTHQCMSAPLTTIVQTTNIPVAIQDLMSEPKATVTFEFVDPTEALIRLLLFSPLAAQEENLALSYEAGDTYDDFCTGDRWGRAQREIPEGASVLTCVIFFDGINMDAKGFATSDGVIIVGGNFRKGARESTYAKSSLGTFPGIKFPKVLRCNALFPYNISPLHSTFLSSLNFH